MLFILYPRGKRGQATATVTADFDFENGAGQADMIPLHDHREHRHHLRYQPVKVCDRVQATGGH